MSVGTHPTIVDQTTVRSPDLDGRSVRLLLQPPVHTQNIWGAFDPRTERILGVQISGESIYQYVANALITPTMAGVRTATGQAGQLVMTLGQDAQGDGKAQNFIAIPGDAMGNVVTGRVQGTTFTVDRILDGPPIELGLTVSSALTGLPVGKIVAFGTGAGSTGTYVLDTPADLPNINTFTLDDNGINYLVSGDGTRWVWGNSTAMLHNLIIDATPGTIGLIVNGAAGETAVDFLQNGSDPGAAALTLGQTNATQNGNAVASFDDNGNLSFGTTTASSLCLISNNLERLCVDQHGAMTYNPPDVITHNSIIFGLNGDGTGTDFLIWGQADKWENSLELRAVGRPPLYDASQAWSEIGATDGVSYGLYMMSGGMGAYQGPLISGAPNGSVLTTNYVSNLTLGTNLKAAFNITPTQDLEGWGYVAQEFVDMTPDLGEFALGFNGFTGTVTSTCYWARVGRLVCLTLGAGIGTSNNTNFWTAALPAEIQPTTLPTQYVAMNGSYIFEDNGVSVASGGAVMFDAASGGYLQFEKNGASNGWTASGTKGLPGPVTIYYFLR